MSVQKLIITSFILCFTQVCNANTIASNRLIIVGKIKGLGNDVLLYLLQKNTITDKLDTLAMTISKEDKFIFKGLDPTNGARFYSIMLDTLFAKARNVSEPSFVLFLDNSSVSINGDIDNFS